MRAFGKIVAFGSFLVGFLVFSGTSSAATFTCSIGDSIPEAGLCYNALEVEGNAAGDFRTSPTWISDFGFSLTVTPGFTASQFGTKDGPGKAVSSQNVPNVESVLEGSDWFNQPMTFVGQVDDINNSTFATGLLANVFYIHAGSTVMAFFYNTAISNFSITSQGFGLSNMRAFNTGISVIPLPAALPLYAAGIGILGFFGWRRKNT